MDLYFGNSLQWARPTPLGGNWDWDANVFGITAAVSVVGTTAPPEQLIAVDEKIDDGDLQTGRFRSIATGRYADVLQ